jgi:starch synthase
MALPLSTTAEAYPVWSSEQIPLPAKQTIEYKYIVQREDRTGTAKWQEFSGNHSVNPEASKVLRTESDWTKATAQTTVSEVSQPSIQRSKSKTKKDQDAARQAQEATLLVMAESSVAQAAAEVTEACPLAVKLDDRDAMRRNFSQSLLCLEGTDQTGESGEEIGEAEDGKATAVIQTIEDEVEEASQPLRGVPLQHIMSFSALVEMAEPEEKDEARKGKKAQSRYEAYNLSVPVVVVTSEIAPFSKTGGLGLVAASYSYEFARNGHRTMIVSPKYKHFDGINYVGETRVNVNDNQETVKYWHKRKDYGEGKGTDFIFVEHPSIQREGGLYNGNDGREYEDNLLRFTLLSLAAMEAPLILNLNGQGIYGDKVLFLANDWQSGLVPLYLCYKYRRNNCYRDSRCIYVIHNLGYQGQYPHVNACKFFGIDQQAARDVGFGNCINLTKGALICSDRILTVSPNYAKEIQTAQGGFNLQDFVSAKAYGLRLGGILNGIDDCWNPETDSHIVKTYSVANFQEGKLANKLALQKSLGLDQDPDVVLMGFVGRLTWQKGVDVLASVVDWLMQDTGNGVTGHAQLIMMGNGDKEYSDILRQLEGRHRGSVCGYVGFDPAVEHQMMAGCDLFLMPSRYEPCGLPQMYSQAYGTLPVVTATGGLVDSVKDICEGADVATGFHVWPLSADKLKEAIYKAAELVLKRPADFQCMQRTAMQCDYYWPKAMDEYERNIDITLYEAPTTR